LKFIMQMHIKRAEVQKTGKKDSLVLECLTIRSRNSGAAIEP
jgi:hypothetical protein